jgi:putative OPT family oligopeptide transporter
MSEKFVPYIPPERTDVAELTIKAVIIGLILSAIMSMANAYFGLYVGMTVSAAIPAAVIATAVLKPFKGTVLEVAAVTTFAAAGEALAAGIIFTIPALLILHTADYTAGQAGWPGLGSTFQIVTVFVVAFIGGMLGVLFTIPLRRILIVDQQLKYPEGIACSEVIMTGEKGGSGMKYIGGAIAIGMSFKFVASEFGFNVFKERFLLVFPESVSGGNPKFKLPFGLNVSPALAAVGYIIGIRAALMVAAGGIIGWVIMIPIAGMMYGWDGLAGEDAIFHIWREYTMYVGIGAIVVGGVSTLWKMRKSMVKGVQESFKATAVGGAMTKERTDTDFPFKKIYFIVIPIAMATFYFFFFILGDLLNPVAAVIVSVVMAVILFFCAFLFTAVAGYIAGILGSSNNPISGVTVTTLLFTAIVLFIMSQIPFGLTTYVGMTATIVVAAIVCCSAAIAGDCMQNMKVGYLLGSTPRRLQISEFGGVFITALLIPFILLFLHQVYTIGDPRTLPAPQAYVMAGVVKGVMTLDVPWLMLGIGVALAVLLLVLEQLKIARISIMAVAIGIYLPITLSIPILIGGLVSLFSVGYIEKKTKENLEPDEDYEVVVKENKEDAESKGILFCSGLIAGEALMGVLIAALVSGATILLGMSSHHIWWNLVGEANMFPGLLVFAYLIGLLFYLIVRGVSFKKK